MADAKDKSEKAEGEATKTADHSKIILVAIIAVLGTLLIGGAITTFFLMRNSQPHSVSAAAESEEVSKPEVKKADTKKKDGKKAEAKGPAIYVALEPPFVVNFDATQAVRFLQVSVEIMTRDSGTAQLLKDNNPLVRNDLLLLFGNQDSAALTAKEGKEGLRKQTLDVIRALTKSEGGKPELVEAVYFTSFVMQ